MASEKEILKWLGSLGISAEQLKKLGAKPQEIFDKLKSSGLGDIFDQGVPKNAKKRLGGSVISRLFGGAIPGLNVLLGLYLATDILEMFGVGPEWGRIEAQKEAGKESLLANAMLIADERKQRREARGDAFTARTQDVISQRAERASAREMGGMNLAAQMSRGSADAGNALTQALAAGGLGQPTQAAYKDPMILLGG